MLQHQKTHGHTPSIHPRIFNKKVGDIVYSDIPHLRQHIIDFMAKNTVTKTIQSDILFTLSEVLTNLIKHPENKAHQINISLSLYPDHIVLDVADDSTPFATFNAKCNNPYPQQENKKDACFIPPETGHGLKCILKLNTYVGYIESSKSPDGLNHFTAQKYFLNDPQKENKKHIFIIDDDLFALSLTQAVLEPTYKTDIFTNPEDALTAFPLLKPHLIICDIHMPQMNGFDLRKSLAHLPNGNTVPFIFLSTDDELKHRDSINRLGVDGFMNKENITSQLLNTTNRLLYRAEQTRMSIQQDFHTDLSGHLKPSLPKKYHDCWHIHLRNQMAEAGGGDFTLYHETEKSMICFLSDVMGHGKKAKFFSYAYAGYLRSLFRLCSHESPVQFLTKLSTSVFEDDFLENIVLTCQGFQIKTDNTIKIVSAGHPKPLHIHFGSENIQQINTTGPLPGLTPDPKYSSTTIHLKNKDKIIFATDGFFQSFGDESQGNSALINLIRKNIALPSHMLSDILWHAFEEKTRQIVTKPDDATLIIIEYKERG